MRQSLAPVLNRAQRPERLLLGCTHYPLLLPALRPLIPPEVEILDQAEIVSTRLGDWLSRHPEYETRLTKNSTRRFATTDDPAWFAARGERLLRQAFTAERVKLRQNCAGHLEGTPHPRRPGIAFLHVNREKGRSCRACHDTFRAKEQ